MKRKRRGSIAFAFVRLLLLPAFFGAALGAWLHALKYLVERRLPPPLREIARPVLYVGGFLLFIYLAGYVFFRRRRPLPRT